MKGEPEFLDFLCIGAPRAGTTWLAAALDAHPGAWIPPTKDLHFFNDRSHSTFEYKYPKGIDFYRRYFDPAPEGVKLGELSPAYYLDPNAAYRIKRHFPNVRLIAMLRNPAELAFSVYVKRRDLERRAPTFEQELERNPGFLDLGYYHRSLVPYFDWFAESQIKIVIHEELFADPRAGLRAIFEFLDIDPDFVPKTIDVRINDRRVPNHESIAAIKGWTLKRLNQPLFVPMKRVLEKWGVNHKNYERMSAENRKGKRIELCSETRTALMAQYEPDMRRLEALLGRSLEVWRG